MITTIVFTSDDAPGKSATATITQEPDEDTIGINVKFDPNGAELNDADYGYLNAVGTFINALTGGE